MTEREDCTKMETANKQGNLQDKCDEPQKQR